MQRLRKTLFTVGAFLLGSAWVSGIWAPWFVLGGVDCIAVGFPLGDFRHKWWPVTPIRDADHELRLEVDQRDDRSRQV